MLLVQSSNLFAGLEGVVINNCSLARHTSWRIGGPAEVLYIPASVLDLSCLLQRIPDHIAVYFLGLGSNTLVRDQGLNGVTVLTQRSLTNILDLGDGLVMAEAGVACSKLARFAARLGYCGIEFMAGIPGTVGGALAMNAGCYGGSTWQFVHKVLTMKRDGVITERYPHEFNVSYRNVEPGHGWFTAAYFKLSVGDAKHSLTQIADLLKQRNQAQPTNLPSCGSVFRNPPGYYAAQLIEGCGLKGYRCGDAMISDKHANFIVNTGNAVASDIESLINHISTTVHREFAIDLVPEVCIIGH